MPPEQVIGSSIKVKYEMHEDTPVLIRLPELDFYDDKEGKVIAFTSELADAPLHRLATPTVTCR
ncbi:MAG: hypothetical protein ACI9VL_001594 [Colwellia sp.]